MMSFSLGLSAVFLMVRLGDGSWEEPQRRSAMLVTSHQGACYSMACHS